jgi:hypothetical protein
MSSRVPARSFGKQLRSNGKVRRRCRRFAQLESERPAAGIERHPICRSANGGVVGPENAEDACAVRQFRVGGIGDVVLGCNTGGMAGSFTRLPCGTTSVCSARPTARNGALAGGRFDTITQLGDPTVHNSHVLFRHHTSQQRFEVGAEKRMKPGTLVVVRPDEIANGFAKFLRLGTVKSVGVSTAEHRCAARCVSALGFGVAALRSARSSDSERSTNTRESRASTSSSKRLSVRVT